MHLLCSDSWASWPTMTSDQILGSFFTKKAVAQKEGLAVHNPSAVRTHCITWWQQRSSRASPRAGGFTVSDAFVADPLTKQSPTLVSKWEGNTKKHGYYWECDLNLPQLTFTSVALCVYLHLEYSYHTPILHILFIDILLLEYINCNSVEHP